MFENMVVVAFQSVFHLKMHQNNIFLFFKNTKKYIILKKKIIKKIKFSKTLLKRQNK
jgi:hypothetical protein